MPNLIKIKNLALDALFPALCLNCRRYLDSPVEKENILCNQCFNSIIVSRQIFREKGFFLGAATFYRIDAVRNLVRFLKYEDFVGVKQPMDKIIGRYLQKSSFKELFPDSLKVEIIPIPLHFFKLAQRGFNQSEDIAKILSEKTGWPINKRVLKRIKDTKSQAKLNTKIERVENMKNSFSIPKKMMGKIRGGNFVVVDDIFTSGATMSETIKTLKSGGAKKVVGFVFAKS
jgi:ComF family protein